MHGGDAKSLQQFAGNGRHAESALALGGGGTSSLGNAEPVDDHKHVVEFAASKRGHYEMVKQDEWAKIAQVQQDRQDAEAKSKALERQRDRQGYASELHD